MKTKKKLNYLAYVLALLALPHWHKTFADPIANLTVNGSPSATYNAVVGESLTFSGSGSFETEPGHSLASFYYLFSDTGTISTPLTGPLDDVTHNFSSPGNYYVELWANDDLGTGKDRVDITVTDASVKVPADPKSTVPEGGTTVGLLGFAAMGVFSMRRLVVR